MQILFYGAGEHAKKNMDLWLRRGLEPVCFVDIDKTKHYKKFDEKYDILPLAEAIQKYPDYLMCVALGIYNYDAGYNYLIEFGISSERIVNADEFSFQKLRQSYLHSKDRAPGLFCSRISPGERRLILDEQQIQICCSLDALDPDFLSVPFTNVVDGILKCYNIIDAINNMHTKGNSGPCKGCHYLTEKSNVNEDTNNVRQISHAHIFEFSCLYIGSKCNLQCVYCDVVNRINHHYTKDNTLLNTVINIAEYFRNTPIRFNFVSGEFLFRHDADDILNYLLGQENVEIGLVINASIYSKTLLDLIRLGRVYSINVSLDAGTKETYNKVKGKDFFQKAVENIEMYSQFGNPTKHLILKYIFLTGINDNPVDIEGFITLAERVDAVIHISADHRASVRKSPLPKTTMDSIFTLYNLAVERELKVLFLLEAFNADDRLFIKNKGVCYA